MRKIISLNRKWAFSKAATEIPSKISNKWDFVNIPHSWNAIDGQDGGNDYYRGTAIYARQLKREDLPLSDRCFLEFKGVNSSAEVFINGEKIAEHHGGYSVFRAEITGHLKNDNIIAVRVDNSPNDTVYPQMADFTFYGGIYRDVNIICVGKSHFDLGYFGGKGIMVTPEIKGDNAEVLIECFVTDKKAGQHIHYVIEDKEGDIVTEAITVENKISLKIPDVKLWNGRKNPYLYTARAYLLEKDEELDEVFTAFGCRSFEINAQKGFILNGEEYPLRGVSRHQDRWGKGNALSRADHQEDIALITEMGANTVRLAHYQQDEYFYDLCDEAGLVVWAEIPYISKHMKNARENTLSQMTELVIQNYNHPSIVVWGLSNEISIGGSSEDLLENHRALNNLCHKLDKTRPTVVAAVSTCKTADEYLRIPDAVAYNHYFGWYGGEAGMNGPWFDEFHKCYPDIPIGCSEYGCEALNWHTSNPTEGDYTEEYQAYYHEELIKQFMSRKYLWATYVWNMFDFGADARNEGGENGQNHKGLVTFDRKYKKDAFFAYKAWLSDEPFVHICGKRYVDRVEDVTRVTVYTNQPSIELFANGISLGKKQSDGHFFYFDVQNKGETVIVAVAGGYRDKSLIRKVESFNEAYRLKEKGAVLNWFDIDIREGFFSLNDKVGEILASKEGRALFEDLAERLFAGGGKGGLEAAGFEITPEMMNMMNGFTLLRLLTLIGSMGDVKFTKEQLLELNNNLNKIKKC